VVKALGEGAKLVTGDLPGLDLMIYGVMLVLVIAFAPRGLVGSVAAAREALWRRVTPARAQRQGPAHG